MEANISIPQVINKWVSVKKIYQTLTFYQLDPTSKTYFMPRDWVDIQFL